ncbi:hypothetical protein HG536_0D05320 [Torulaspora globosa]|uniref:MARVEL domain-containing protein n=1 Tax=Torulaspora globosa TaxID=48254 RepID=A0A7G3ZHM4_9SACH|nr:uncharacterized protein HG536_0D05320 [Torulaspora globosa]QLL33010.1 hypothetical protein HG536_0D05320 [Torulaspora globosa]
MLAIVDNILRLINFAFFVILLGLIGDLLSTQVGHSSRVNFCMFAAAFGIVTDSFYGILANIWEPFAWPIILFVLDFLNFVFTFTAATALAVGIRTHSCTNQAYLDSNRITQGSTSRCREAQASVAFFYFLFFIFLAKMIMSGIGVFTSGPFASRSTLSSRKSKGGQVGVPTISQV